MTDFESMSREELVAAARGLEAELARVRAEARGALLPRTLGVEDDSLSRFEQCPLPMYIFDQETLEFLRVNDVPTSSAQRDIAKSYDLHADQFVTKPVGLNVLAGELKIIEGLAARARQAGAG